MKKISVSVSSLLSRLCAGALALVGFGCSDGEEPDEMLCMYGTPTGSFEVKGNVVDSEGMPVSDAVIIVTDANAPSSIWRTAEGKTDDQGEYNVKGSSYRIDKYKVVCKPSDPTLEADSTIIDMEFKFDDEHKRGEWYVGHADVDVDFKLKEKKAAE